MHAQILDDGTIVRERVPSRAKPQPFRLGFASLNIETDVQDLPVQGEIPPWLDGCLVPTGPGKFETNSSTVNHWFDGMAMLHRFGFDKGKVNYKNRFLQSRAYKHLRDTGTLSLREFGTDPTRTFFGKMRSLWSADFSDNANVNVAPAGNRLLALTETPHALGFDATSLATEGVVHYGDGVDGHVTTAHPHYDFDRNRRWTFMVRFGRKSTYEIVSADRVTGLDRKKLVSIPAADPAYMHSFSVTERYIILVEAPFFIAPLRVRFGSKPYIENYRWLGNRGTHFTVIEKDTGRVVTRLDAEPNFSFHHVNAFEIDGNVVLDLIAYPDATIITECYLDNLRNAEVARSTGHLLRYVLPLGRAQGHANKPTELSAETLELPRINYRAVNSRPYRYLYAAANARAGNFLDKLVKFDVERRESISWSEATCYPGEPVFVTTPKPMAEDDGVVLSVVLDSATNTSFLLVLDGHTFKEIGRCYVPHHIPFSFHGQYIDADPSSQINIHR